MANYKKYSRNQSKKAKISFTRNDKRYDVHNKTGCQWRMIPREFGPWQTVYFYFRKWKFEGTVEELMHHLRKSLRKAFGKSISPSVGLIDSGSVRTSHHIDSSEYGIDFLDYEARMYDNKLARWTTILN